MSEVEEIARQCVGGGGAEATFSPHSLMSKVTSFEFRVLGFGFGFWVLGFGFNGAAGEIDRAAVQGARAPSGGRARISDTFVGCNAGGGGGGGGDGGGDDDDDDDDDVNDHNDDDVAHAGLLSQSCWRRRVFETRSHHHDACNIQVIVMVIVITIVIVIVIVIVIHSIFRGVLESAVTCR